MPYAVAVANTKDMRPVRPFSVAFGEVVRARLTAEGITQTAYGVAAGRDQSYISERVNGRRAFTTDDIDVLADLISAKGAAIDGRTLIVQLAQAAKTTNVGGSPESDRTTRDAIDIKTARDARKQATKPIAARRKTPKDDPKS